MPLCVFESRKEAALFGHWNLCKGLIVRCTYKKSLENTIWIKDNYNLGTGNCRRSIVELPTGTVLADSVTCLE